MNIAFIASKLTKVTASKLLMIGLTGCLLLLTQHVTAQNCAPSNVAVTPASCATTNNGAISVTPQPCGEKCYDGTPSPITDCANCSQTYQGSNLNITVNTNQKACILGNSSVSNITVNGGTLVVCGSVVFQNWMNVNVPASIVILGSASFQNGGINLSHASSKLYNYGTLSLAYNLTILGEFHNYGTATVNADLNINDPSGKLFNYKTLQAKASLNNGERLENRGTINVGTNSNNHKLQLNSSSYTLNSCTINVTGDALVNASSMLDHRGRFTVSRDMVVNGNSTVQMSGGTKIRVNRNFTGESGILSRVGGSGCSLIETMGSTLFNGGMILQGNIAYCNRGSISGTPVRRDGAVISCTTCFPPDGPPQETFSISWAGPGGISLSGPQISNLAPGNYQMTLVCGNCTYNNSYTVNAPAVLNASVVLSGDKTSATASASGGTAPYTFTWTGPVSGTGNTLSGLTPGSYTVTARDVNNCEATSSFEIPAAKCNPEISQTPISCFGANDGQITITDAGCPNPEILWLESGSTGPSLGNLGPGMYRARIVCEGICMDTAYITLTEPTAVSLTTSTNAEGIITLTSSGGTGAHTYGWYAAGTLRSSANNSTGLAPGTYEARATDERGCTDSETVNVNEGGNPCEPQVTVTNITCQAVNGKLEVDPLSICASAVITWTNNADEVVGTGPVLYALAGVYTVTVLCEDCTYSNSYTINAVPPLTISAQVSGNTANVLVTGGTMPFLYQWTNNGRIVSTSQSPEVLPAGLTTILVVDANGCSAETSVTLNTPACTPDVDITPVSCNGSEDGAIIVSDPGCPEDEEPDSGCTATPVTPPADQLCNCSQLITGNGVTVNVSNSKVCIANNTNVSSITFHGTGMAVVCGSATIGSINFNNAGKLVLHGNTTVDNMNFNGSSGANGRVYNYGTLTFPGGFSVAGIFYNHKSMTVNGDLNINDNRGKVYNTGTIQVNASLNNNEILENSGTINVGVNPLTHKIHLNSGSQTVNACTMNTVGELLMDASSVLEYKSEMSVGTKLTIQGGSILRLYGGNKIAAKEFAGLGNGSKVELTGTSCAKITIEGKTQLENFMISGQISYCDLTPNQGEDEINNSQFVNGAGQNCVCNPGQSSGSSTFTWFGINATGPSATGLGQGTYSVGIHCPGTCYSIHDYTVPAPPALTVDFTVSVSGQVDTEVTGGTPFTSGEPYTYAWTSSNGAVVSPVPDPQLPAPGVYTLVVTDSKNCTTTVTVTWDSPPCQTAPVVNITDASCGSGRDGKIEIVDPQCASGTITYLWSGPGITDDNRNSRNLDNLIAGTYTLQMTCGGACSSTLMYEVRSVNAINIKSISVTSELACRQAFNGALTVEAEGGSGEYNYQWSDTWKTIGTNSPVISNLTAGVYYVTVTDKNGTDECIGKGTFTLDASEDCHLCSNGDILKKELTCASVPDGELEVVMNDAGTYIFEWNTGETTAKITNLDAGIYIVEVTHTFNGDQCYMRTFLNEPEGFAVDIVGDTVACPGENIRLEAVSASPVTFSWTPHNPGGVNNPVFVTTQPGVYAVTAAWGSCVETAAVTVVPAAPLQCSECEGGNLMAVVTGTNLTCNASADGRAEVLASGGSEVYTYIWSNGSRNRILRDVPAGSYSVSITDQILNCTITEEVTITEPAPLQISIEGNPFVCHASSTMLSATGSSGTYTWTKMGTNEVFPNMQTISVRTGGTYRVEVRSENGLCTARSNDFPLEQQPEKPTIFRSKTKMCPGDTIELRASVATNIRWSTGETTQVILVTEPGTYTVQVQPGNCQPTGESVTVTLKSPEECEEPSLCEPQFTTPIVLDNPCIQEVTTRAEQRARERWEEYIDAQRKDFQYQYIAKCIQTQEELTMRYKEQEYHYTLFYYDQAGNLVRTVPPKGVNIISDTTVLNQIAEERAAGTVRTVETAHTYMTTYQFNSSNHPTGLILPDHIAMGNNEKISEHSWYDELGRMVLSQTSFQYARNPKRYQYVLYDKLGREVENGEVRTNADPAAIQAPGSPNKVETSKLRAWLDVLEKYEVHRNYYDTVTFSIAGFVPQNLRNRMTAATYEVHDSDNDAFTYDNAIHYSYDVHGNVKEQVTDYPELEQLAARYKFIAYVYDLISQNILETHYQKGRHDQFFYRNEYDADNRLVQVWTSRDYIHWDRDVKQFFYDHGPVARTEIGHEKVQGMDYAYTIHGWVKGMNSNLLSPEQDMGKDGLAGGLHRHIPADEMGYSLGFYQGDYSAIGNSSFLINTSGSELETSSSNLYNGNISGLITSINQFMKDGQGPLAQTFRYDQLNRLKESRAYEDPNSINNNTWSVSGTSTQKYMTKYTYDANGNILTLKRNAHAGTTAEGDGLDDLVYQYENNTNKLISVEERRNNSGNPDLDGLDDIKP